MSSKNTTHKSDWGEEVMPGVYMMRREGAPNPFAHPALQAMESFDLKQLYDKIDECEDLIQKLLKSNDEMIMFFLPESEKGKEGESSDEDEEEEEEDDDEIDQHHVDPNNNNSNSDGGGVNSMEALMAMAEAEAERYLNGEDNEDGEGKKKKKKGDKNQITGFDETNPPPKDLLDKLPSDISEAILENLDIIRDQRKQQKELLEFSAVRQHKCSCHRVHGTAANSNADVIVVPPTE